MLIVTIITIITGGVMVVTVVMMNRQRHMSAGRAYRHPVD